MELHQIRDRRSSERSVQRLAKRPTYVNTWVPEASDAVDQVNDDMEGLTHGALPPEAAREKFAEVHKLCQEDWQPRHIMLTSQDLIIALPMSTEISDRVPLGDSDDILANSDVDAAFNIHTIPNGYNCGRQYCFRVETREEVEDWVATLTKMSKETARKVANRTMLASYRFRTRKLTASLFWQRTNSLLIIANLVVIIAQTQALPLEGSTSMQVFQGLDIMFTAVFAAELVVHLFAYWFWDFFSDGWFVFDFVVVTISVSTLMLENVPGASILRLLRTFRVLRLFNKLRSLRTLINALATSIFPVLNAFLIVVLVCVVFAILGVQLFGDRSPENFGSFLVSYWTMFEISTFDGWTEKAKALSSSNSGMDPVVACFMCTFIGLVCWVLLPVVVAVLLDNFVRAVTYEKLKAINEVEDAKMKEMGVSRAHTGNPIDPLLEVLSRYKNSVRVKRIEFTAFSRRDLPLQEDLSRRIGILFRVLDIDLGGTLDFHEIHEGLKKMIHLKPHIHLSSDDYQKITQNGAFCNADGEMDRTTFEQMLREELRKFTIARVAAAYETSLLDTEPETNAILGALKLLINKGHDSPVPTDDGTAIESGPATNAKPSPRDDALLRELGALRQMVEGLQNDTMMREFTALRQKVDEAHNDIVLVKQELLRGRDTAVYSSTYTGDQPFNESKPTQSEGNSGAKAVERADTQIPAPQQIADKHADGAEHGWDEDEEASNFKIWRDHPALKYLVNDRHDEIVAKERSAESTSASDSNFSSIATRICNTRGDEYIPQSPPVDLKVCQSENEDTSSVLFSNHGSEPYAAGASVRASEENSARESVFLGSDDNGSHRQFASPHGAHALHLDQSDVDNSTHRAQEKRKASPDGAQISAQEMASSSLHSQRIPSSLVGHNGQDHALFDSEREHGQIHQELVWLPKVMAEVLESDTPRAGRHNTQGIYESTRPLWSEAMAAQYSLSCDLLLPSQKSEGTFAGGTPATFPNQPP